MYEIVLDGQVIETATTQNLAIEAVTERMGQEGEGLINSGDTGADYTVNARAEDGRWLQYVIQYNPGNPDNAYEVHPFHDEVVPE